VRSRSRTGDPSIKLTVSGPIAGSQAGAGTSRGEQASWPRPGCRTSRKRRHCAATMTLASRAR